MIIRTRALSTVFAAVVVLAAGIPGTSQAADDAQIRALQQQIQELSRQVDELSKKQAQDEAQAHAKAAAPAPAAPAKVAKEAPTKFDNFLKGFYGTLDISLDYSTKGMGDLTAFSWSYANPLDPASGYVKGGQKGGPVGRVGWLPAMASNKSNIGYRATHKIGDSPVDFIVQVETALNLAAAPGLNNTWTKSSNTVTGAIGLGDTYIGLQDKSWGKLKFGTLYAPYKTSTDRLNPFSGMLGDYSVIMGNTGGDNRVEFGTRLDHTILYNSPKIAKFFSFDVAYAFGQNVTYNNVTTPLQSPDCSGGNAPGSGNLPLNCDDGGFGDAYSIDIKFETESLYLTAAAELHRNVNRNSDGIGSNSPQYNLLLLTNNPAIDFATFNGYVAEFPGYATVATPGYLTDIGDEKAFKIGGQYKFPFALTVSAEVESMRRNLPAVLEYQNERQRTGTWLAASQELNAGTDTFSAGWAHANATPGDPAGQHNFNPTLTGNNQANMYTVAWTHRIDKQLSWYIDGALTVNDGNAHYDIGAGGHGIKTDCHDGTNTVFTDFSSAGPTTWGGCRELGFSTGLDYKF
jgi:predicted porin